MTNNSNNDQSLTSWVSFIFDHPVTKPEWYWNLDAPDWEESPRQIALLIAETFEQSGNLLASFSDEQLNQGFWHLTSAAASDFMRSLIDPTVEIALRFRALRSFIPLFEQVMAKRCSQQLSHLEEAGANPLNSACYMWWDILPICGCPNEPWRANFDSEVLAVLRRLLIIPHDACRESALHGIGHWAHYYPQVAKIVEEFLTQTPCLRPELRSYAEDAKLGLVR